MEITKHKNAVIIENKGQERTFRSICKKHTIYAAQQNKNMVYPHYELLINAGVGIYAVPNLELQGSEDSVLALGYAPITLKQFAESNEE